MGLDHFLAKGFEALLWVALAAALLLPSFEIDQSWPKIEVSDVLLLPLGIMALWRYRLQMLGIFMVNKRVLTPFVLFIMLVAFSIIYNERITVIRDWFEPLKLTKFLAYTVFFAIALPGEHLNSVKTGKTVSRLTYLLTALVVFNVFHYFNILNFNTLIEPYYAPPHHLDYFGLNSLGEPDTRRSLGTMGNPNMNALLFVFFLVFLLPASTPLRSVEGTGRMGYNPPLVWSSLAIVALFMCQSRTALIAFIVMMVAFFILSRSPRKLMLFYILITLAAFAFFAVLGNSYLTTIADIDRLERAGIERFEQWSKIIRSMPGHWFFGHAPAKEYFEANDIYSESEYFLILFRYGIAGLLLWLTFWGNAIRELFKRKRTAFIWRPALFAAVFFLGSVTNNLMHSNKLSLFLAFGLAFLIKVPPHHEK